MMMDRLTLELSIERCGRLLLQNEAVHVGYLACDWRPIRQSSHLVKRELRRRQAADCTWSCGDFGGILAARDPSALMIEPAHAEQLHARVLKRIGKHRHESA
jgi:hypothetical protein